MDTEKSRFTVCKKKEGETKMFPNTTNHDHIQDYPAISDELIKSLERDFPNRLPEEYINDYELGILIGEQKIISKLKFEKEYNEKEFAEQEDEE